MKNLFLKSSTLIALSGLMIAPLLFFLLSPLVSSEEGNTAYHRFPQILVVRDCQQGGDVLFYKEKPLDFANTRIATKAIQQVVYVEEGQEASVFFRINDGVALGAYPNPFECGDYSSLLKHFSSAMRASLEK